MEKFDFIREMLSDGEKNGAFTSAVAGVGQRDRTLYTCAVGRNALGGEPTTLLTRYDMASVTKIMATTMVAFKAIENGDLTLYDTLSVFFDAPEDKKDITVFQLMTHTGGIEPVITLSELAGAPERSIECILRHPLAGLPGVMPRYSCMGYMLLGAILEKIYGARLDALAQKMVFEPLGLSHTGFLPQGGNFAATEVSPETGVAWQGVVHDENARYRGGVSANAGLFSDLGDCMRFCSMLAQGGVLEGKRFLSKAMLDKATRNYTPGQASYRGLGFHMAGSEANYMGDLFSEASFGHTGFTGTCISVDPSVGIYLVLLTNRVHPTRDSDGLFRIRRRLHNAVRARF